MKDIRLFVNWGWAQTLNSCMNVASNNYFDLSFVTHGLFFTFQNGTFFCFSFFPTHITKASKHPSSEIYFVWYHLQKQISQAESSIYCLWCDINSKSWEAKEQHSKMSSQSWHYQWLLSTNRPRICRRSSIRRAISALQHKAQMGVWSSLFCQFVGWTKCEWTLMIKSHLKAWLVATGSLVS